MELSPDWFEFVTNYGIDSASLGYPVEASDYPNFAPPLLETTPLVGGTNRLQIGAEENQKLWNYFWTSRSISEQSNAFGTRPMLFGWLLYSDQHNGNLNLIRDPKTFESVTLTIEGFIPTDFTNRDESMYTTIYSWATNLPQEQFSTDQEGTLREDLTTEGGRSVCDEGIGEQFPNAKQIVAGALMGRIRKTGIPQQGSPASLQEAIRNNPDVFTTPEERFSALTSRFENYRAGRRVPDDITEPSELHLLNIGLETGGTPTEARALFLQQQARQRDLQSELDMLNQSQHNPETPGPSSNQQFGY